MKRNILLVVLAMVVAFTGLMLAEYTQESKPVFNGANDFTTAVNTERAKRDLKPVVDNQELVKLAEYKCNDMVSRNYNAHKDPDGKMIWDYAPHGFKYGENLAGNYYSSYETMQAWVISPTHYENIIDPAFTQVGHFTCYGDNQYMTVEVFRS